MKRSFVALALLAGCAQLGLDGGGWTTLIDGEKGLDNFDRLGDANWRGERGAIVADKGKGGFLMTKNSYRDFQLRAGRRSDQVAQGADPAAVS
jgi:hypothetical protein